jgi:hypothetical protein
MTFNGATGTGSVIVTQPTYSLSGTAASATKGSSGTSTITVSSTSAYAGTVTLSCSLTSSPTGATDLPSCSGNQTVTLSSATPSATATFTLNTTAASSALNLPRLGNGRGWIGTGETALAVLFILWVPRRRRLWQSIVCGFISLTILGSLAACGGGGGITPSQPTNPGTSVGTYTFALTGIGSDGAKTTATTTFTLTVN